MVKPFFQRVKVKQAGVLTLEEANRIRAVLRKFDQKEPVTCFDTVTLIRAAEKLLNLNRKALGEAACHPLDFEEIMRGRLKLKVAKPAHTALTAGKPLNMAADIGTTSRGGTPAKEISLREARIATQSLARRIGITGLWRG